MVHFRRRARSDSNAAGHSSVQARERCPGTRRLNVAKATNANLNVLLRRGCGYSDLRYLRLKAQRMTATKADYVAFRKVA